MAAPRFHDLTIAAVRRLTDQAVALQFDIPTELKDEFRFLPGQYLTLRAIVGGEDVRRSYSICSALSQDILEVGIKQVEGGVFSNHAAQLQAGDRVQVMPPQGRFTVDIGETRSILLLAAGSGITPCLSIARSVLEAESDSAVTLVYGNSNTGSIMFRSEIDALKDRFTNRLHLIHVLSREHTDIDFLNGRLDGVMVNTLSQRGIIDVSGFGAAYLCGPQEMIEDCSKALTETGMAKEAIRFELFTTGDAPQTARPRKITDAIKDGVEVSIILDGSRASIRMDGAQDTVLSAAQAAGLDLPFSCAGGMCCTCRCKVVSGEAEMDVNYSLQDWEIEAGFTLACQTRPKSAALVLDFDAS